jgi:hypothetical protein
MCAPCSSTDTCYTERQDRYTVLISHRRRHYAIFPTVFFRILAETLILARFCARKEMLILLHNAPRGGRNHIASLLPCRTCVIASLPHIASLLPYHTLRHCFPAAPGLCFLGIARFAFLRPWPLLAWCSGLCFLGAVPFACLVLWPLLSWDRGLRLCWLCFPGATCFAFLGLLALPS